MADPKDRAPKPGSRKAVPKKPASAKGARARGPSRPAAKGKTVPPARSEPAAKPAPPDDARRAKPVRAAAAGAAGSPVKRPRASAAQTRPAEEKTAKPRASARARKTAKDRGGRARPRKVVAVGRAPIEPGLTEEERIEAAKYIPGASAPRVFEEERFLFPESYGVNRVRLHVKDPEWLFAYWDVAPASIAALREELGERAFALSRVTLRVVDVGAGGESVILLPPGARSWYVRTAQGRRSYRAELGVMLPSGEFRSLAQSNTVVAPRGGPSPEKAARRRSYRQAVAQSAAAAEEAARAQAAVERGAQPWNVPPQDAGQPITPSDEKAGKSAPGGASDVFRR